MYFPSITFKLLLQNYCEDASTPVKPSTTSNRRSKPPPEKKPISSSRKRAAPPPPEATDEVVVQRTVKGFSDFEIRRFVKSYRKYGEPKTR